MVWGLKKHIIMSWWVFLHYFVCGLYGKMLDGRKSRTWKAKTWCRLARRRYGGCGCKKQFLLSDKDECRWCGG